jgi:hypothetical protein
MDCVIGFPPFEFTLRDFQIGWRLLVALWAFA